MNGDSRLRPLVTAIQELTAEVRALRSILKPEPTATVDAWHSINSAAYHDHPNCPHGKVIFPQHRRAGTGNRRRCGECKRLHGPAN